MNLSCYCLNYNCNVVCSALLLLLLLTDLCQSAPRGGPKRGKGKNKKNILPFLNIKEHRLTDREYHHPSGAKIRKSSYYAHNYRLGYKIKLICVATGNPLPEIKWYKDGAELAMKPSAHVDAIVVNDKTMKSRVEIDPATAGDAGIYTCMAHNEYDIWVKNFQTNYGY